MPGCRHRIPSRRAPRMAARQPASCQPGSPPGSMRLEGFERVGRTRRNVTTHRWPSTPNQLGGSHQQAGQPRREAHRRRRSFNNSPIIVRSSAAERRSSDDETPRWYSPPASGSSRANSLRVARTRRRTRLRTTAVPTDLGTARWTRAVPPAASNDALRGPRRTLTATGGGLPALRPNDEPLTLPVGSVPCGGGTVGQRVRRESSFWSETRVSYAFSLCWVERGAS